MVVFEGDCPIWGSPYVATGVYHEGNRTYQINRSPRAGGRFQIDEVTQAAYVSPLSIDEKARLTTWLVDQRLQGVLSPKITQEVIKHAKSKRALSVSERAERLLRYIERRANTVATTVAIEENTYAAYAWSESTEWGEVEYLLNYLQGVQLIDGTRSGEGHFWGRLTVAGYNHIAERQAIGDPSQAFVAMWFDETMTDAYQDGIKPAIVAAGYKPQRIDQKEHINKIDDEIIAEIRRSRFVVADFTHGKDGPRGGVYYEAEFAHGLNLPVIFTCRKDAMGKVHFDTNHYNHIVWTTPAELREQLNNRILAVIGEGPEAYRNP